MEKLHDLINSEKKEPAITKPVKKSENYIRGSKGRITVEIDMPIIKQLKKKCLDQDTTPSKVLRHYIQEYLK